jgi:hypothetical protein
MSPAWVTNVLIFLQATRAKARWTMCALDVTWSTPAPTKRNAGRCPIATHAGTRLHNCGCEVPERLQRKIGYRRPFEGHRSSCLSSRLVLDATGRPISMDVRCPKTIAYWRTLLQPSRPARAPASRSSDGDGGGRRRRICRPVCVDDQRRPASATSPRSGRPANTMNITSAGLL